MWGDFLLLFSLTLSSGFQGAGGDTRELLVGDGPRYLVLVKELGEGGLMNFSDGGSKIF